MVALLSVPASNVFERNAPCLLGGLHCFRHRAISLLGARKPSLAACSQQSPIQRRPKTTVMRPGPYSWSLRKSTPSNPSGSRPYSHDSDISTTLSKTLTLRSRRDKLAWSLTLVLVICALYRANVINPLGVDAYLLYAPGVAFILPLIAVTACSRPTRASALRLIGATLLTFSYLCPARYHSPKNGNIDIRLVSLNIRAQATDMQAAIREITSLHPDFICLQEIWHRVDLEEAIKLLPEYKILGAASRTPRRNKFNEGTFLAVRQDWSVIKTSLKEESAVARLSRRDHEIVVGSVHAPRSNSLDPQGFMQTVREQVEQAKNLDLELRSFQVPVVIAGDFNAPESGPAFKILKPHLHSAFGQSGSGLGLSYPSKRPLIRIDHAMGTKEILFTDFKTHDFGSDHLGLIVDFRLPP